MQTLCPLSALEVLAPAVQMAGVVDWDCSRGKAKTGCFLGWTFPSLVQAVVIPGLQPDVPVWQAASLKGPSGQAHTDSSDVYLISWKEATLRKDEKWNVKSLLLVTTLGQYSI